MRERKEGKEGEIERGEVDRKEEKVGGGEAGMKKGEKSRVSKEGREVGRKVEGEEGRREQDHII